MLASIEIISACWNASKMPQRSTCWKSSQKFLKAIPSSFSDANGDQRRYRAQRIIDTYATVGGLAMPPCEHRIAERGSGDKIMSLARCQIVLTGKSNKRRPVIALEFRGNARLP